MTSSGEAVFRVLGFASRKTLVRAAQLVQARARLQPHMPAPEPKAFPMYHIPICPTFKSRRGFVRSRRESRSRTLRMRQRSQNPGWMALADLGGPGLSRVSNRPVVIAAGKHGG